MTHHLRHTLLLLATFVLTLSAAAQSGNIRYVSTTGDNAKDGTSWATAKKDIQDAINDLVNNNLSGEVWVAAGTYYPTETTESTTSLYYKAFKIPAGITVRGGFRGKIEAQAADPIKDTPAIEAYDGETSLAERITVEDKNFGPGDPSAAAGNLDGEEAKSGVYANKTILCGDLNPDKHAKLTWNNTKQQFDIAFYGNSYHVVWFAMNGFNATTGRANPLSAPAKLEGCIVEGGHANTRDVLTPHPHIGYGGGIYMVLNSFVYNCEVRNCDASRNGGGIYMDGGGIVRRTYVHDCQTLGLGTDYGYGGGICQDGGALTSKERPCVVAQSVVTNCVGRMGGGIAIMGDQTNDNGKYAVVSNSTLVNNCTATIEAGGVYTYKGGGAASLTIVRNRCNGSGITQGGTLTGRAGGLFSYDAAYVANTVMWGNECGANRDIQYANATSNLTGYERTKFYHNALSNADIADWSTVEKMGVVSLESVNDRTGGKKGTKGFTLFKHPTATAGYFPDYSTNTYDWAVSSESSLTFAGINTADLDKDGVTPAPTGKSYDMQLGAFNARPTIGAFTAEKGNVSPASGVTYGNVTYDYAFFVDPEFIYTENNAGSNGANWTTPIRFLGNALDEVDAKRSTTYNGKKVAIFVKEGTVNNTRDESGNDRVRLTSLDFPSGVTVIGSFDESLTGINLTKRNVVQSPTTISAQLMDNYDYNVAHLIAINGKQDVTLDGFKISFANASSPTLTNDNRNGAAITLTNSSNIHLRNIIVSNSTADRGAAVYADHSAADFENCIFHNNEISTIDNDIDASGIIYATNGSALTFDHCDVLRNVGHASYLGDTSTNRWQNSIFYANLRTPVEDTNIDRVNSDPLSSGLNTLSLAAFSGATTGATGDHCMFDARSAQFASQFGGGNVSGGGDTGNKWQYNLQYAFIDGTGQGYPRYINPTKNAGVTRDGDATYYGRATSFEPHNNNPAVNMASHQNTHTEWGTDIVGITRDFGGLPDIGAVENHEATEGENAYKDGQREYGEVLYVRDYRNADGTIDTDITNRDGSSWARAINGNGDYSLSGTHTYKDTHLEAVMAYKINTGTSPNQYYLDVNNGTLNRVNSKPIEVQATDADGNLLIDSKGNPIMETYNPVDHCTVFILCDADGKDILYDSGNIPTAAKRLKDASTGEFLYLDYVKSNNTYTFRTSANPPADQATATITASSTNYRIAYKANNTTKYIGNANTIPGTTQTAWTFGPVSLSVDHGTGVLVENASYNMGTFKGLQYAVNKAHIAFKDSLSYSGNPKTAKKQVWVGAGVYQRDPAKNTGTTPAIPIVEMDEENCFIIQDGVDVYGAFPKTGNPGMDQREALVSQYVHVLSERNISNVADYETILEPATKGVASDVKRRVLGQPYKYNPDVGNNTNRGKNGGILYCGTDYVGIVWDGFTLRDGVWDSKGLNRPNRYGGAGAAVYRNVTLKNVVVTNNTTIFTGTSATQDFRAGGIYMDGGTLDAGYVINNTLQGWNAGARAQYGAAYGGGMYIFTGTVFNSVIASNHVFATYADGAATFIESANFFNNTIVNNKAEGTKRMAAGIAVWTDPNKGYESALNIYNTICVNNEGYTKNPDSKQIPAGNVNVAIQNGGFIKLYNCITQEIDPSNTTPNVANKAVIEYENSSTTTKPGSLFESLGVYGDNFANLNLRLKANASYAINTGNGSPVIGGAVYNLDEYNDMDFDERIQDCRIDIGAYEFNGATGISPDVTSVAGQAIFYVTPEGYGTTNAHDPENAACAAKLQHVLDAAGRYKYLNPGKQVIVKVANSYDFLHPNNGALTPSDEGYVDPVNFTYYATRTTDWTDQDVRVWSIIVPRGVEVWGGYTDVAQSNSTHGSWTNTDNGFTRAATAADVTAGKATATGQQIDNRNITANPTYFDSYYRNKLEKTDANTYHVVSFTDRIYDLNGYAYTKADFAGKTNEQIRNILENGTASAYVELLDNDESHFVHMSEDIGGLKAVTGNVILDGTAPKNFGTAENPRYASNRAVIDGIFVSGGKADAPANSTNTTLNINSYGGGAIVTDYAYVRNCIITGNRATNGGGLALTHEALVSGSLIIENTAENMGGGLYIFEHGAMLSNGITIDSSAPAGQVMDYRMPHVLTSTIVANSAHQGGGVWYTNDFDANARFNSVIIWQNAATDQANVYGMVNPEQPTEDETPSEEYYPFGYSIIQNIRASGTNNQSVEPLNSQGVRFVKAACDVGQSIVDQRLMAEETNEANLAVKFADFGFFGLTRYSTLCSTGMPKRFYNQLKESIAIADDDILGTSRTTENNAFVEVGARALAKQFDNKQLMLRLFVANPEDVDTEMAGRFMQLGSTADVGTKEEYYAQEGSSFAYPFNFLQEALDYVKDARDGKISFVDGTTAEQAANLPFEILIGKGEYWPHKDLNGDTKSVWAHTFAIPEGVTLIGGFDPQGGGNSYYGRYYCPNVQVPTPGQPYSIYDNVQPIPTSTQTAQVSGQREIGRGNKSGNEAPITLPGGSTVTFQQWHIQDIADRRGMYDNNKNGIIEPWEFRNQTIISGNAVNGETDGVYHVMTAVADEDAVGRMPKVQRTNSYFVGSSVAEETGYQWKEEGQQIRLNGLIITGGNALTYLSTALDDYGSYMYYHGAGLLVDGNRYKNHANDGGSGPAEFHNSAAYGLGYRDIPVSITNCQFRNNIAGYGGAISSNGSLSIFASSFEQNKAVGQTETPESDDHWYTNITGSPTEVMEVAYPGQGGAIHATNQLSAFNTLFANNEACLGEDEPAERVTIDLVQHPTFRVPNAANASATLRAAGGAIMMGSAGTHHIVNCDFVRNKANAYPAVFTMNPTFQQNAEVNTHDYSQIINTVAWGNEVNAISSDPNYLTASKLMVNVGKKNRTVNYIKTKGAGDFYSPEFTDGNVPTATQLSVVNAETSSDWQEAVWFCAYEDGMGFKQNNTNDLRDAIIYSPVSYAPKMIMDANGDIYQNCNIQIVADNTDVAGPNFGNPSYRAGYDGFMEGADWSPARFNRLTDQGNGWIKQSVEVTADDYVVTFHHDTGVSDDSHKTAVRTSNTGEFQGAYSITHYIGDLYGQFPEYELWLALGDEKYMQATNDEEKDDIYINNTQILPKPQKNLPRISPDPTMGVTRAYIDIGVYEYQKQPLLKPGSEVDILWVSTKERPENGAATGATWRTPTSDLQRAIETLLSSRNGHKKEIRIMEGEYTPVTLKTIGGVKYSAFVIDTESLNGSVITPSGFNDGTNNDQYYAQSLTIKGGYSSEIMYEYDPAQYKTVLRQDDVASGVNTDYLIYIKDPTLRYAYGESSPGVSGYKEANKYGATYDPNPGAESNTARTMPIQIDGVTLINDKAAARTKGSTIYYPDYPEETAPAQTITEAHSISVGGEVVYYETKEERDKVDSDGVTHIGTTVDYETEFALITETNAETISNPAKLVITKTQVVGSGSPAADDPAASAVYIGQNGGSALIYNSVFHSNYGMPLDAWNTVNVNNTFGLNAGLVQLRDDADVSVTSQMHNSALWRNNPTGATTYGDQLHINGTMPTLTGAQTIFTYNAFTGGAEDRDYTAPSGTVATNNFNTGLTDENRDLIGGPNFIDPENASIEARNFDIKPSVRLLNRGNDTSLEAIGEPDTNDGNYYTRVVRPIYDYSLAATTDRDVLYRPRINMSHIDLGAYEFQGSLLNPLYVDPNKSHSDAATGENWDNAFGYGDIQNAMDLAALYHINQPTEEGYVFVKGASATNRDLHTDETLTIRDGVTVYGSIISSYSDWHAMKKGGDGADNNHLKYANTTGDPTDPTNYDINAFIADMASIREGIASHAASKTVVTGIRTSDNSIFDDTSNDTPALLDGFVISPVSPTLQPTAPVLDVTNTSAQAVIALRNIIVADNDLSGAPDAAGTDIDVAQVSNGLIYEVLMRDNKPKGTGAVLQVSDRGYAVNVTVEGKTIGANGTEPVDGMSATEPATNVETATQIFYSVTNSVSSDASLDPHAPGADAPYGRITNKHISGYFYNIGDANLNYQLTETSRYIDQCYADEASDDSKKHPSFLPAKLARFITYSTDRDLLGNPRLLVGVTDGETIDTRLCLLDRGAFETWKVDNTAHRFNCGELGTINAIEPYLTNAGGTYTIIKKHFYPHDGSVCYIMAGQSLVIDPFDPAHEVKATAHNPGFMLLKEGANFYGNGRPATCAYVAVERTVHRGGSIVSMPYAINYDDGTTLPQYDPEGYLTRLLPDVTDALYDYDGSSRSAWDYIFQPEATGCWREYSATRRGTESTPANHGVLYEPIEDLFGGDDTMVTLRFTAKGASLTDYVYTEDSPSKTVVLTQYDDIESTGGAADFTTKEDMGWNCFGLPYLVSDYHPYDIVRTDDGKTQSALAPTDGQAYRMDIPHTLWLYYDGLTDGNRILVNGDGGYYSVNAWETASNNNEAQQNWHVATPDEARIWVGEGFFTQTATTAATETLTFYLPDSASIPVAPSPRRNARNYYGAISNDSDNDSDSDSDSTFAPALLRTEYYNAAGQRIARPDTIGVTIVREVYSDGTVRTFKTR